MSYSNTLKLCNAKTIAKKMTIYKAGIRQEALAELVNPQRENFPVSIYPPLLAIPPLPDKKKLCEEKQFTIEKFSYYYCQPSSGISSCVRTADMVIWLHTAM